MSNEIAPPTRLPGGTVSTVTGTEAGSPIVEGFPAASAEISTGCWLNGAPAVVPPGCVDQMNWVAVPAACPANGKVRVVAATATSKANRFPQLFIIDGIT